MKQESFIARGMNAIVAGYVYFVAFILVLYMVSSLAAGFISLGTGLLDLASSSSGLFTTPELSTLEVNLLHTIAFTFVLVKAYMILITYAQTLRINIKFLVEISIIGPAVELVFNSAHYDLYVNMLLAAFGLLNLFAYLFFYNTLRKVNDDYHKDNKRLKSS